MRTGRVIVTHSPLNPDSELDPVYAPEVYVAPHDAPGSVVTIPLKSMVGENPAEEPDDQPII